MIRVQNYRQMQCFSMYVSMKTKRINLNEEATNTNDTSKKLYRLMFMRRAYMY